MDFKKVFFFWGFKKKMIKKIPILANEFSREIDFSLIPRSVNEDLIRALSLSVASSMLKDLCGVIYP